MVPSEPQNLGPKLSKSLVNTPLGVNKPVEFGARKQPAADSRPVSIRYNGDTGAARDPVMKAAGSSRPGRFRRKWEAREPF